MKEKRKKEKHSKSHRKDKKKAKECERKRRNSTSSSTSSGSGTWVEKESMSKECTEREDWMAMTGQLKTYKKEDIRPRKEEKGKNHIDSYNPATNSRELNPYWKNGGTGIPLTTEQIRQSKKFLRPSEEDDYYTKPSSSRPSSDIKKQYRDDHRYNRKCDDYRNEPKQYDRSKSFNWKNKSNDSPVVVKEEQVIEIKSSNDKPPETNNKYMSDEKMNLLGAKIVKAEIMGDMKQAEKLKAKLEAARQYRKEHPEHSEQVENVMLLATCKSGNTRPLMNPANEPGSSSNKRKSDTHISGERAKYFGNDEKYNLKQMFQNEKYGDNYNDEAELAKIASKSKNPNDDLEDIFLDEISKSRNEVKDAEREKQRAISQHVTLTKSLEGCEYCVDSKSMLKYLMVSCSDNVYVALPSRKSVVEGQCIISTTQHATCVTALDENVWEEISNYRKALTSLFNSQGKDVIFFETASKLHKFPHMVINCIPLPRDVGDSAAIYFKKALLECEGEWAMNKKVVELKGKGIRKGVPKGLPYFWVDFGMEPGFAHVIEDQHSFPSKFAEEIIAGILDLDPSYWKSNKKEFKDLQRKKVMDFLKDWKSFDPVKNKPYL